MAQAAACASNPITGDPSMAEPASRLVRVREGAILAGVLGGVARWLGWDATLVRIVFVLCSLLSAAFPGIIVYLVLWLLMPRE